MSRIGGTASVGQGPLWDETADGETKDGASVRADGLMERVLDRGNMIGALRQVRSNDGSPGVDRMDVEALCGYLKQHWPGIRQKLLEGCYQPQPVRRVVIPKANGGQRPLGIPMVLS